jgi:hypothetical protein
MRATVAAGLAITFVCVPSQAGESASSAIRSLVEELGSRAGGPLARVLPRLEERMGSGSPQAVETWGASLSRLARMDPNCDEASQSRIFELAASTYAAGLEATGSAPPAIAMVEAIPDRFPFFMRPSVGDVAVVGSAGLQTVRITGVGLVSDPGCSPLQASFAHEAMRRVDAFVLKADPLGSYIDLALVPPIPIGRIGFEIQAFQNRSSVIPGCTDVMARGAIDAVPETRFRAFYSIRSTCSTVERRQFDLGGFRIENSECVSEMKERRDFVLPIGWEYLSHRVRVLSNNDCDYTSANTGSGVQVYVACPPRGGFACTGGRNWFEARVTAEAIKTALTRPGEPIAGEFLGPIPAGESRSQEVAAQGTCVSGTNEVSVTFTDGDRVFEIPPEAGTGEISSRDAHSGAGFTFDPAGPKLTVTAPYAECRLPPTN